MFSEDEKRAFDRDDIVEVKKLHAEYTFYWQLDDDGDHSIKLGLKLWEMDGGGFYVTQSHHVHTPGQAGPYHSSRAACGSAHEALLTGLDNIRAFGKGALREGHPFDEAWFIPNKHY